MMNTFWQDIRFGFRMMYKNPGFTSVAVITLALGIGLNTSIFSVVDGVLLKPLPYRESGQLVKIEKIKPQSGGMMPGSGGFTGAGEYLDWKDQNQTFSYIAAYGGDGRILSGEDGAERIPCGVVTHEFFGMLGVQPIVGRVFSADDDAPSSAKTVMLSYGFWLRRYGGELDCIGKILTINGQPLSVIGVLPSSFHFINDYEVWLPMALDPVSERVGSRKRIVSIMGRLKPDIQFEQAVSDLNLISARTQPAQRLLSPPSSIPQTNPVPMSGKQNGTVPLPPDGQMKVMPFNPNQQPVDNVQHLDSMDTLQPDELVSAGTNENKVNPLETSQTKPLQMQVGMNSADAGSVRLIGLHEYVTGNVKTALWVLMAAVGCVLLIACANIANLLLARAAARQKEIAVRTAIGASRSCIIRQLLTESLMLSLTGGILGFMLSVWGIEVLKQLSAQTLPSIQSFGINGWALGFTVLMSTLTGILFGAVPALHSSHIDLNTSMKDGNPASGRSKNKWRKMFVISEMSLAFVLLICAGLLIRSFVTLRNIDLGFNPENLLTLTVNLSNENYPQEEQRKQFYEELITKVKAIPNVRSAALTDHMPLTNYSLITMFDIEGKALDDNDLSKRVVTVSKVSQDFFSLMGIRLIKGRVFNEMDRHDAPASAVINKSFADRYFPGEDPIGKQITEPRSQGIWATIIGVVDNVLQEGLGADPFPEVYWHDKQFIPSYVFLAVKTIDNPAPLAAAIRSIVASIDRDQPVHSVLTMEQRLADTLAPQRLNMILLGTFAAVALLMALIGIYGVMSYLVTLQTREIGIRIALGAQMGDVIGLFLRYGLYMTLAGIGSGVVIAMIVSRALISMLHGIQPGDSITYICVSALFLVSALLACYIPARRAANVDPMTALRCE